METLMMNRREFLGVVAASAMAQSQSPDVPTMALLGQALIRHDLRRESPASFERMRELLQGTPIVFTNFEAAVQTSLDVRAAHAGLIHNAEPETLDCLREMGVNLLALSSNHAADLGPRGISATIQAAKQRGMVTAGAGGDIAEAARPGLLRTSHGTIAMVGFESGGSIPGVLQLKARSDRSWESADQERILAAVRSAAGQADWVLAYHHNHEYDEKSRQQVPETQQQIARLCVDAGATLYVAHGFPGIRGIELYKGCPLFHGLGNFIFETRRVVYYAADTTAWQSIVVKCRLERKAVTQIRAYPVSLRENQRLEEGQGVMFPAGAPRPAVGEEAQGILGTFRRLCDEIGTSVSIRDEYAQVMPK
jgi:poly-gamma-glutamate capsule biosynthesis protein CapA/YwtB (metallophosphatase superfamily)